MPAPQFMHTFAMYCTLQKFLFKTCDFVSGLKVVIVSELSRLAI